MHHALILFVLLFGSVLCEQPTVHIKHGKLQGKYMEIEPQRRIVAFMGVPYAQPPLGELRFQAPQPVKKWDGVRDATKSKSMCMQLNPFTRVFEPEGDEDCLYLNVYTPNLDENAKLPVMYWIHGGGFVAGNGNEMLYGPDNLLQHDVVLVTVNYRLAALGFFSTDDDLVEGSAAMKDQAMGMRWVRDNIKQFGGDPDSVTIFGESAGGGSVHLHLLSPTSRGLFHGAILQSGFATCEWALYTREAGAKMSRNYAELFNCPTDDNVAMVDCMRKLSARQLVAEGFTLSKWDVDPLVLFRPVIEPEHSGAFITDFPENLYRNGKVADVPIILGTTKDEGAFRAAGVYQAKKWNDFDDKRSTVLSAMFGTSYTDKVMEFYYKGKSKIANSVDEFIKYFSDVYFTKCLDSSLILHKKYIKSPIYQYLLTYKGTSSYAQFFGTDKDLGVSHCDDLLYLFPKKLFKNPNYSAEDQQIVDKITTLWTNFARYKNPTPDGIDGTVWQPITSDRHEFLDMGKPNSFRMDSNLFPERVKFWRQRAQSKQTRDEL